MHIYKNNKQKVHKFEIVLPSHNNKHLKCNNYCTIQRNYIFFYSKFVFRLYRCLVITSKTVYFLFNGVQSNIFYSFSKDKQTAKILLITKRQQIVLKGQRQQIFLIDVTFIILILASENIKVCTAVTIFAFTITIYIQYQCTNFSFDV